MEARIPRGPSSEAMRMKKQLAPLHIPLPPSFEAEPDTLLDQFCAWAEESQTQSDSDEEQAVQHQHADCGVACGGRVKLVAKNLSAAAPAAPEAPAPVAPAPIAPIDPAASTPTLIAPVAPMAFTAPVAPHNLLLGANIRTASASTPLHPQPSHLNGVRVVTASADVFGQLGPLGHLGQLSQGQGQGQSSAAAPAPAYVAPALIAPVAMQAVVQAPASQQAIAKVPADDYVMVAFRPIVERMGIFKPFETLVGTAKLDKMKIRQKNGGPNHGKFVAHDPVVLMSGKPAGNANKQVKRIVGIEEEDRKVKGFLSREYVDAGNSNGEGKNVLLDLLDMIRMLQRCNIPGIGDASAQLHVDHASGASAPQAFANLLANDEAAQSIRAGAAAGGAAGGAAVLPGPGVGFMSIDQVVSVMTDMKGLMADFIQTQAPINNSVHIVCLKLEQMDTESKQLKTSVTDIETALAKRDAEQVKRDAEYAKRDAAMQANMKKMEARFKETVSNMIGEKRKRDAPARFAPGSQVKPKPKPRDPVADKATWDYAMQHWQEMVRPTTDGTFIWYTDMIVKLEEKGVPGDLTMPQIKLLMWHFYKVRSKDIVWTSPTGKKQKKAGFKGFSMLEPAEHAQFVNS